MLSPDEVGRRFPPFRLVGDETCYYEPGAGFLRPEACIATQLDEARTRGALVHGGQTVRRITPEPRGVTVVTDSATYAAGHVIVTAGAWTPTHVRQRLAGVSERCLRRVTCLYTVTPDFGFIIDRHPASDRILVGSPCSGHGVKHSAAIGEALAEVAIDGRSRIDLAPFTLARFR